MTMNRLYCLGCGRPLPCSKKVHNQDEQARLDAVATRDRREWERRDFDRRIGGRR
ncbi:hypothetical protein [Agrococcus casei]|uniref:hypothetical protein n=1 Tax=Agrococcus casei TaxID=343512 RepID=UPI003F8E9DB9